MASQDYDAVIVGAGHNGLVCGAYLARAGLKVVALDRRDRIGGAAVSEEVWPGFHVSVASFVMVLLQPKVMLDLELQSFGMTVIPVPPAMQTFPDGRVLIFQPDETAFQAELARFSPTDAARYPAYAEHMRGLAAILRRIVFEVPIDPAIRSLADFRRCVSFAWRFRDVRERFHDLWDLMTLSAHDYLRRWFQSPEILAAFGSYASGSGGNLSPRSAGSAYVLSRPFLRDTTTAAGGNGLVQGGMGQVSEAIARSGARFGLETRTGAGVAEILIEGGRACGVRLESGEVIRARRVISNASAKITFGKLVAPEHLPEDFVAEIARFRTESTCYKINLAVEEPPRFPAFEEAGTGHAYPGGITICPDLEGLETAFDAAKHGEMAEDPYLWLTVPSMFDSTIAPKGKHVVSILGGHVPYTLRDRPWDEAAKEQLYRITVDAIARHAPGFGNGVIGKQVLTPPDLERLFALPGGHVHHGEMSFDQVFFKRPARHHADYRSPVAGLYQCGASAHPGGGVTGTPGHNAAHVILGELGRK